MALDPFTTVLLMMGGSEILGRIPLPEFLMPPGERGQLKLSRAQLALQEKMFGAQQEGTKLAAKESRRHADEMITKSLGLRREERSEDRMMQMLGMMLAKQSEDKARAQSMLNTVLAMSMQAPPPTPESPMGMVGVLRR